LTQLVTEIFSPGQEIKKGKVIIIAVVKFPLLYAVGYSLLGILHLPPVSLLIGFTLIFLVMFLKAMGRWMLSMSQDRNTKAEAKNK